MSSRSFNWEPEGTYFNPHRRIQSLLIVNWVLPALGKKKHSLQRGSGQRISYRWLNGLHKTPALSKNWIWSTSLSPSAPTCAAWEPRECSPSDNSAPRLTATTQNVLHVKLNGLIKLESHTCKKKYQEMTHSYQRKEGALLNPATNWALTIVYFYSWNGWVETREPNLFECG